MNQIEQALKEYNVHVYRYQNLVYIATFKCASTYYTTLLQSNGWSRIQWDDIDWNRDHTFGFLIDPVTRYVKALAEDYINEENTDFEQILFTYLEKALTRSTLLTYHSIPICTSLKQYVNKIDWIPIDTGFNHHSILLTLLDHHRVVLSHYGDMVDPHIGTSYKKELEQRMFNILNSKVKHISYQLLLSEDIELFERVKTKINPNGILWDNISWLRTNNE
jgi:hypothetical protein